MHHSKKHYFKLAILALLCSVTISVIAGADSENKNSKNIRPWIERPWAWRYLMYISPDWDNYQKFEREYNEKIGPKALDRQWKPLFDATRFFQSNEKGANPGNGISVVLIEFDKDGKVTTPNAFGKPLNGRIDQNMRVTLAEGESDVDRQFDIGHWFLGLGDASSDWAPSICSIDQMPSPFDKTNTSYLYGPVYEIHRRPPIVGCREWAYQIKDPGRPYIDVTSYIPKRFDRYGSGTYIKETIGWRVSRTTNPLSANKITTGIAFTTARVATSPALFLTSKHGLKETAGRHPSRRRACRSFPIHRPSQVTTLESESRKLLSPARVLTQSTHFYIAVDDPLII